MRQPRLGHGYPSSPQHVRSFDKASCRISHQAGLLLLKMNFLLGLQVTTYLAVVEFLCQVILQAHGGRLDARRGFEGFFELHRRNNATRQRERRATGLTLRIRQTSSLGELFNGANFRCTCRKTRHRGNNMAKSGGSVHTGGATRLVYIIGLLKWFALGAIALGVLGATVLSFAGGGDHLGPAISLVVWVYGIVAAIGVYVTMGWLQQTLLMLVGIAKNTAAGDILSRF